MLFAAKTRGKTRLIQYIIIVESPFKTSTGTLQVMLSNFKNIYIPQEFCLPALEPYGLP